MLETTIHIAVRRSEGADNPNGHDWIDTSSAAMLRSSVKEFAEAADRENPKWAEYNPVVRIAPFSLKELP